MTQGVDFECLGRKFYRQYADRERYRTFFVPFHFLSGNPVNLTDFTITEQQQWVSLVLLRGRGRREHQIRQKVKLLAHPGQWRRLPRIPQGPWAADWGCGIRVCPADGVGCDTWSASPGRHA